MTFSELLISKREELHLSLREAAQKIGISHGYLDKLEKGFDSRTQTNNKPTPETLRLIANAYNLDYMQLMVLCGYVDRSTLKIPSILENVPFALYEGLDGVEKLSQESINDIAAYLQFVKEKERKK